MKKSVESELGVRYSHSLFSSSHSKMPSCSCRAHDFFDRFSLGIYGNSETELLVTVLPRKLKWEGQPTLFTSEYTFPIYALVDNPMELDDNLDSLNFKQLASLFHARSGREADISFLKPFSSKNVAPDAKRNKSGSGSVSSPAAAIEPEASASAPIPQFTAHSPAGTQSYRLSHKRSASYRITDDFVDSLVERAIQNSIVVRDTPLLVLQLNSGELSDDQAGRHGSTTDDDCLPSMEEVPMSLGGESMAETMEKETESQGKEMETEPHSVGGVSFLPNPFGFDFVVYGKNAFFFISKSQKHALSSVLIRFSHLFSTNLMKARENQDDITWWASRGGNISPRMPHHERSPIFIERSYAFQPHVESQLYSSSVLFVAYQLIALLCFCHSRGVIHGNLTPNNILLTKELILSLTGFNFTNHTLLRQSRPSKGRGALTAPAIGGNVVDEVKSLPLLTDMWCEGSMSNYEYLIELNKIAGRSMGNRRFSAVLPWVIDFGKGEWRDLSRSKHRLAKGDAFLEMHFQSFGYHLEDIISSHTYLTYIARKARRADLEAYVRRPFVPQEYPQSMTRLYDWTSDECIPEFYSDPSVIISRHDGLEDLSLPEWAKDAEEFIKLHRTALESPRVSASLHLWIDIAFGCLMTGTAAVENLNVPFMSRHVMDGCMGRIFSCPHPHKKEAIPQSIPTYIDVLAEDGAVEEGNSQKEGYPSIFNLIKDGSPKSGESDKYGDEKNNQNSMFTSTGGSCHPGAGHYEPPVSFSTEPSFENSCAADVFAVGCVLYELFVHRPLLPQQHLRNEQWLHRQLHPDSAHPSIPPQLLRLIRQMTASDYSERPSFLDIMMTRGVFPPEFPLCQSLVSLVSSGMNIYPVKCAEAVILKFKEIERISMSSAVIVPCVIGLTKSLSRSKPEEASLSMQLFMELSRKCDNGLVAVLVVDAIDTFFSELDKEILSHVISCEVVEVLLQMVSSRDFIEGILQHVIRLAFSPNESARETAKESLEIVCHAFGSAVVLYRVIYPLIQLFLKDGSSVEQKNSKLDAVDIIFCVVEYSDLSPIAILHKLLPPLKEAVEGSSAVEDGLLEKRIYSLLKKLITLASTANLFEEDKRRLLGFVEMLPRALRMDNDIVRLKLSLSAMSSSSDSLFSGFNNTEKKFSSLLHDYVHGGKRTLRGRMPERRVSSFVPFSDYGGITSICVCPKEEYCAVSTENGNINIFRVHCPRRFEVLAKNSSPTNFLRFLGSSKGFSSHPTVAAAWQTSVLLWSSTGSRSFWNSPPETSILSMCTIGDSRIGVGTRHATKSKYFNFVNILDATSCEVSVSLRIPIQPNVISYSEESSLLFVGGNHGEIIGIDSRFGNFVCEWRTRSNQQIKWLKPMGRALLSSSTTVVHTWDPAKVSTAEVPIPICTMALEEPVDCFDANDGLLNVASGSKIGFASLHGRKGVFTLQTSIEVPYIPVAENAKGTSRLVSLHALEYSNIVVTATESGVIHMIGEAKG